MTLAEMISPAADGAPFDLFYLHELLDGELNDAVIQYLRKHRKAIVDELSAIREALADSGFSPRKIAEENKILRKELRSLRARLEAAGRESSDARRKRKRVPEDPPLHSEQLRLAWRNG